MRIFMYIDGFNLYHAIDDIARKEPSKNHLKWLDLHKLGQNLCIDNQILARVKYYSAYATWKRDAFDKHTLYVNALKSKNVECVMSSFKRKRRKCFSCHDTWDSHEEKETDVKIAVDMVVDAYKDLYDRAILVSADTDFIPAMKAVRDTGKSIMLATPPKRNKYVSGLKNQADVYINLTQQKISECRLDDKLYYDDRDIICPDNYKITS